MPNESFEMTEYGMGHILNVFFLETRLQSKLNQIIPGISYTVYVIILYQSYHDHFWRSKKDKSRLKKNNQKCLNITTNQIIIIFEEIHFT